MTLHGSEPHPDQHDDDIPVGRILSRREALSLLGFTGAATLLAACQPLNQAPRSGAQGAGQSAGTPAATAETAAASTASAEVALPTCVARPAMTEGPYFVDVMLNRSDIRS
ncbi:MAG: hypothetical protein U0X20_15045, partial [Caldilineaceae bacterium]